MFPLYGAELQQKLDSYANSCVSGGIFGERVARYENHVRIDPNVKDRWGIPVLHIEARDSDNERNLTKDAADSIEEWFHEAGWELICKTDRVNPPGYSIHEVGTCRMGNDPKKSVLNKWCQSQRREESFCGRWGELCYGWMAEPNDDDSRALDARLRVSCGANAYQLACVTKFRGAGSPA